MATLLLKPQSQQQFITLPKHAIVDENLTLAEKGLYVVLFSNTGKFNYTLTDEEEVAFKGLIQKGYVTTGGKSVDYQILRIPTKTVDNDEPTLKKKELNLFDTEYSNVKVKYIKIIEDRISDIALREKLKQYYNIRFSKQGKFASDRSNSQRITITKTLDALEKIPTNSRLDSVQQAIEKEWFSFYPPTTTYNTYTKSFDGVEIPKDELVEEQLEFMKTQQMMGEAY